MRASRPRVHSLHIIAPQVEQWLPARPPTPHRSGSSLDDKDEDNPPVPPLSYWEPETPGLITTPLSPFNPFLQPPGSISPTAIIRMASPMLPSSPLSIFDRIMSPMSPTYLWPRTPPVPSNFLNLRSPPLPSPLRTQVSIRRRHSTISICFSIDQEKLQHEGLQTVMMAIREKVLSEMAMDETKPAAKQLVSLHKEFASRLKTKTEQKKKSKLLKQKRFKIVKEV